MKNDNINECMILLYEKCYNILKTKNSDYAGIEDPFKNFKKILKFGLTVEQGIIIRMTDKISRIETLLTKTNSVKDETIEDTVLDLINYTNILLTFIQTNGVATQEEFLELLKLNFNNSINYIKNELNETEYINNIEAIIDMNLIYNTLELMLITISNSKKNISEITKYYEFILVNTILYCKLIKII